MSTALVPVKRLTTGKSRLLPELGREQLEALSLAMLEDVIEALQAAPSVDRVAVVTPDRTVALAADSFGAEPLLLADPGLNPSLEAAARALDLAPSEPLLVVLGDVAGATAGDIEILFEVLRPPPVELDTKLTPATSQKISAAADPGAVALAPSNDGGTAALLRRPHDAIPPHFGPGSAKLHRQAAARAGVAYTEVSVASLATDLDCPEDIELFLQTEVGGRHTRELLRHVEWGS
jgi:2-phospho-L-lactate guanylyltransferase